MRSGRFAGRVTVVIRGASGIGRATAETVKHVGRPGGQAAAICFLCFGEAAYITGQTARVDGGWPVT